MSASIRECGRTVGGGLVVVDVTWDGALEGSSVAWVATIVSDDGQESVALVLERTDAGTQQYVEGATGRRAVAEDATVEDDHVTARFPQEVVGVAVDWPVWKAALVVDGHAVSEAVIPTT